MRRCCDCKLDKDESEFYRNRTSRDGLATRCTAALEAD